VAETDSASIDAASTQARAAGGRMTIRRRLLLILLAPLTLLLSFGIALDYSAGTSPLNGAFDQALANEALAVAAQLHARADGRIEFDLSPQAVEVLRSDKYDSVYFLVRGANGEFFGGDDGLPAAPDGDVNPTFRDAEFAGHAIRAATYRVANAAGQIAVTVAETTHKRQHARRRMLTGIILSDVVQLAGILALVWLGVRLGLRPLLSLRAQIDRRSARDLAPLDETDVPGEVRPLTRALNRLFATVHASAQGQLQFLANAAHQLRTPLAGLQTQIELLIQDPTAVELRAPLKGMLDGTRRLGHTANQLLALARAEPTAAAAADFHVLDLRELAEEAVAGQFDLALQRHIDLGVEASNARVLGSRWLLREVLLNLVGNALAYTPANGRVTVRCGQTEAAVPQPFIEVEDDGPGIAPEQRARVVERFYRAPGTSGDGCGLGLAIVEEISRAHRAELDIGAGAHEVGARVRVTFPVPGN
jgi:two-component system sensor histidine kinase TctE